MNRNKTMYSAKVLVKLHVIFNHHMGLSHLERRSTYNVLNVKLVSGLCYVFFQCITLCTQSRWRRQWIVWWSSDDIQQIWPLGTVQCVYKPWSSHYRRNLSISPSPKRGVRNKMQSHVRADTSNVVNCMWLFFFFVVFLDQTSAKE